MTRNTSVITADQNPIANVNLTSILKAEATATAEATAEDTHLTVTLKDIKYV
jgi:hypothetical protein